MCCLSSLNVETWERVERRAALHRRRDALPRQRAARISSTVAPDGMERARYAALRERSVGLGVMGFHSFLQAQGIPFESALAKSWNLKMFRNIRRDADAASRGARARSAAPAPMPPSAA